MRSEIIKFSNKTKILISVIFIFIIVIYFLTCCFYNAYNKNHQLEKSFSIKDALKDTGFDSLRDNGFKGQDITIAVIDTGAYLHKDIYNSVIAFKDFVNNKSEAYDDNGHGTEICGIIAGSGCKSNGKYYGVAPKARLVVVKALDKDGASNLFRLQDAVSWLIENKVKYNIKIIHMSFGYTQVADYQNDPLYMMVEKARENGILVIASCGNNGNNKHMTLPGDLPNVISVGSVDYLANNTASIKDRYEVSDYTSLISSVKGRRKPDLTAPGTNLITICPKTKKTNVFENYISVSGTSYAAAVITGEIALIWSKYNHSSSSQIESKLLSLETIPLLLYKE